jgi:hypothetical protein
MAGLRKALKESGGASERLFGCGKSTENHGLVRWHLSQIL